MAMVDISNLPVLDRNEFEMWKHRMKYFLILFDCGFWRSIEDGPYVPMVNSGCNGGVAIPKVPSNYTVEDMKKLDEDKKAHAVLVMALPDEIYNGLVHCESAKELWDSLCERLKEIPAELAVRRKLLAQQYELFAYIGGESLTQQFERFESLVCKLKSCGVIYENEDVLCKFMRSLPCHWSLYTTVIRMTTGFTKMTLVDLYWKLKTYELEKNQDKEISHGDLQVDVHTPTPSPSPQPFISTEKLRSADLSQLHPDDVEEMDLAHQLVMLNFRIEKFVKRTGRSVNESFFGTGAGFDKSKVICYNCQKMGHFARECKLPGAAATTSDQVVVTGEGYD